jgi:hypothetical protein
MRAGQYRKKDIRMSIMTWLNKKIVNYLTQEVAQSRGYLCDFDRLSHEIRPADVLLVEGCNRVSLIINKLTKSAWSHSALYVGRLHDIEDPALREILHQKYKGPPHEKLVIESHVGKGTIVTPLNHYKGAHLRICRPTGISHNDAQLVIGYAISHIGKLYDVRQFLDLGRFLLRSRLIPRRMGSILFKKRKYSTAYEICSEMIANAFMSIDFPILPVIKEEGSNKKLVRRNPRMTTPSDFDYSPYFEIIKYPIFILDQHAKYRDLPWTEDHISMDGITISEIEKETDEEGKNHQ